MIFKSTSLITGLVNSITKSLTSKNLLGSITEQDLTNIEDIPLSYSMPPPAYASPAYASPAYSMPPPAYAMPSPLKKSSRSASKKSRSLPHTVWTKPPSPPHTVWTKPPSHQADVLEPNNSSLFFPDMNDDLSTRT